MFMMFMMRLLQKTTAVLDTVFVKLQQHRKKYAVISISEKIAPKFYGPYRVLDKHGKVANKLAFPEYSTIHPMCHGFTASTTQLPTILQDTAVKSLEYCLQRKMAK
ncbi:hypothetical protein Bca4012_017495 [Brassica carinata]